MSKENTHMCGIEYEIRGCGTATDRYTIRRKFMIETDALPEDISLKIQEVLQSLNRKDALE